MADESQIVITTPITTDSISGHQKAIACAIVGPVVTFISWLILIRWHFEVPSYITESLITFWSTIFVWLVPANSKLKEI